MTDKRHFRFIVILAAAMAVVGAGVFFLNGREIPYTEKADIPDHLPLAHFYTATDQKITLDAFKGHFVLVNLWATWCPPCIAELPALDNLQARLREENFEVVAIALDRSSIMTVMSFLKQRNIEHLDVYWDKDRQIPLKWKYSGVPVSFLLDETGKVIEQFDGPREWDKGEVFEHISELVGKTKE